MTTKKFHKQPTDPDPFGFMAGTVIDDKNIVAADPESWVESKSDPLNNESKGERASLSKLKLPPRE
jgi:hypothetical protein